MNINQTHLSSFCHCMHSMTLLSLARSRSLSLSLSPSLSFLFLVPAAVVKHEARTCFTSIITSGWADFTNKILRVQQFGFDPKYKYKPSDKAVTWYPAPHKEYRVFLPHRLYTVQVVQLTCTVYSYCGESLNTPCVACTASGYQVTAVALGLYKHF
jgi:hypothetical protein